MYSISSLYSSEVEQWIENPRVSGSIPLLDKKYKEMIPQIKFILSLVLGFFISSLVAKGYRNIYLKSESLKVAFKNYEESIDILKTKLHQIEAYNFQEGLQKGYSVLDTNNPLNSIAIAVTEDSNTVSSSAIESVGGLNVSSSSLFGLVLFIGSIVVIYVLQHQYYKLFLPTRFFDNSTLNGVNIENKNEMSLYLDNLLNILKRVKEFLIDSSSSDWFVEDVLNGPPHLRIENCIQLISQYKDLLEQTDYLSCKFDSKLIEIVLDTKEHLSKILFELYTIETRVSDMDLLFTIIQEADRQIMICTVVTGIGF
jgi:hypothetical protein